MGTLLRLRNIDEPLDLERVVDYDTSGSRGSIL